MLTGSLTAVATVALGSTSADAAPLTKSALTAKLAAYERSRGGTFSVALYDRHNGSTFYYQPTRRNETLSIVKVLVMATVLRRCQERKVNLTSTQVSQANAMITRSDNTATNVHDQLQLMNGVIWGTAVLTIANREYLKRLMALITSSQRWGICVPPLPSTAGWRTKNGWGPQAGGYRLNSIGQIWRNGRDYTAVILSRAPAGFYYGRDTVNGVSKILYDAMASPLA